MLRKKRLLVGVVIVVTCVVIFFLAPTTNHPEKLTYKGRSLEVWSQQAVQSDTNAAAVLKELGPRAVPGLTLLLKNDEPLLRRQIWSIQSKLPSILRRLIARHIRPPNAVGTREAAAFSLGVIGLESRPAVPELVRALHDPDHRITWRAATALGHIGKDSAPLLIGSLQDKD